MGICKICGEKAGWLRSYHKECRQRYDAGQKLIDALIIDSVRHGINRDVIEEKVSEFANAFHLDLPGVKPILLSAWDKAVEDAMSDNLLSKEEEKRLMDMVHFFGSDSQELAGRPSYHTLVKGSVIRDLCEGKMPTLVRIDGPLPVVLQKGEQIIWVFKDTKYYETQTKTTYVGGSQSINIRIAKGVYYRVGAFRGNPVQTTSLVYVDTGLFVVTNKHLTFVGARKSVRLKHEKIISLTPYSDGVGLCRDAVTAKPQIFVTNDGWFTYNVVANAMRV